MNEELKKLTAQIMAECLKDGEPVTEEEARDMAEMELNAKGLTHAGHSVQDPDKPKKPKTVKISDEKKELFSEILSDLEDVYKQNVKVLKENKLIQVKMGEKIFKIDVIEQRNSKK